LEKLYHTGNKKRVELVKKRMKFVIFDNIYFEKLKDEYTNEELDVSKFNEFEYIAGEDLFAKYFEIISPEYKLGVPLKNNKK